MKRHQILFTGPMVRAILEGRKTQTRRLHGRYKVGDVLWVRETWARIHEGLLAHLDPDPDSPLWMTVYRADGLPANWEHYGEKWKPSIHMPAWASRIDLEVTEVRAQRLQEISEEDAIAEGAFAVGDDMMQQAARIAMWEERTSVGPREYFRQLWNVVNKPGGLWRDNPTVWAYTFKRINP